MYVCDITDIPKEILSHSKSKEKYLLSIIDHFSKFSGNYLLDNKSGKSVLNKINDFIVKNGIPDKILTDNGGEFMNKDIKKYCKKKGIELIHCRPRHPQTQGAVERYNRTIKDLLKTTFIEYENKGLEFDIKNLTN